MREEEKAGEEVRGVVVSGRGVLGTWKTIFRTLAFLLQELMDVWRILSLGVA